MENQKPVVEVSSLDKKGGVPQETSINPMSVGGRLRKGDDFSLYQPHNYRLYFDFDKEDFTPPKLNQTDHSNSVVTPYQYKIKNSKEHFFKGYKDCNVTVKKNQVEILNLIDHKRWYVIKHEDDYEKQCMDIDVKKTLESIGILKKFIKEFGGKSGFRLLNTDSENKVKLEDTIDKIPIKYQWNSKLTKKVYKEASVEFKGSVFAANYFDNSAIKKVAPDIAAELRYIRKYATRREALFFLKQNVLVLNDVIKYKEYVGFLSDAEKEEFTDYLFKKFGV